MSIQAMKQALEALELAKHSHGRMLLSDPPQEAWKTYRVDDAIKKSTTALRQAIEEAEKQCQCPACKIKLHASDCAVHNAPAHPAGQCDCGAEKQEPVNILAAKEYADARWSDADVPLGWLKHFVDALGKQQIKPPEEKNK